MTEKNHKKHSKKKKSLSLLTHTTFTVFFCLLGSIFVTITLHQITTKLIKNATANLFVYILLLLAISSLITIIAFRFFGLRTISQEERLRSFLSELARGNFNVRISPTKNKYVSPIIDDFNKLAQELDSVKIMRNDFVSSFSHELKTPIVTINGFAELLLADDVSEAERKEYAQIIYDESKRLTKLSQSILLINKLNAQAIIQNKTTYSLDEQLRQCIAQFMREIESKQLQVECEAEAVTYYGDSNLLQQVWINLFSNAVKFSPKESVICVKLKTKDNHAVVSISDEGCGMSEETIAHVYDQFYQGDSSHTTEGNGLGLSIVQRIVQLCEGNITIESKPEEGSTFTVTLPLGV